MVASMFLIIVVVLVLGFWLWMLAECATKEPSEGNDKLVWVLIIIFANVFGALIYWIHRRPQRVMELGR